VLSQGIVGASWRKRDSAQRLSASEVLSLLLVIPQEINNQCSTPFGIRGVVTLRMGVEFSSNCSVLNAFRHQRCCHHDCGIATFFEGVVLNAFRHQRCCHTINWFTSWFSLYVLNAFRHQRCCHQRAPLGDLERSCAQRLSASEVLSRGCVDGLGKRCFVLNAFRHQRCCHP